MPATMTEKVLFEGEGVLVTVSRITSGPDTLFVQQIASVSLESRQLKATPAGRGFLVAAGPLALIPIMAAFSPQSMLAQWYDKALVTLAGLLSLAFAVVTLAFRHLGYRVPVVVTKSDGSRDWFWFADPAKASKARLAIEQAVLSRTAG